EGGPVRVFVHGEGGAKASTVQPPTGSPTLRDAFANERTPVPLAAKAGWLASAPAIAESGVKVVACALPAGAQTFAAILLDREPGDAASLRPLMGAWGAAIAVVAGSAATEQARAKLSDAERKSEEARVALLEAQGLRSIA